MMSIPPISSLATSDTAIDLQDTFKESLSVVRDVTKGVLLKHWGISLDGFEYITSSEPLPSAAPSTTPETSAAATPAAATTASAATASAATTTTATTATTTTTTTPHTTTSPTTTTTTSQQPQHLHNNHNTSHNNHNKPLLPTLYQTTTVIHSHPHLQINVPPQLQQNLPGVEYPRKLENLFPRSNSILALQNTNPTNRSNVQQQMIARLQEGYQSFSNPSYSHSNNPTTYSLPGSAFNLEKSSSNGSLSYNLSLPPLAPAQRSPHLDNLLIRKTQTDEKKAAKKAKANKIDKAEKLEQMKDRAKFNLPVPVWMRILEFSPPIFLRKARLINKEWKSWVDEYQSIHINCRRENFGYNMPEQIPGLSAKQYVDLLGGKGCMEPGCKNKDASRTHWAWKKRWCLKCWKAKIEREDRVHKQNQSTYTRTVMDKLLECIPVSMYDSFGKPHDYVEDSAQPQANQISTHRLYKYYLNADVKRIMEEYEALTPEPFREDPTHDAQQKATARQIWEDKMAKLEEDRDQFFQAKKAENDKLMQLVIKIEAAIREKRAKGRKPNDANRESRKNLFIMAAKRDLPQIPIEFVQTTIAFKAAIRIFRDGGSERGWRTLMPKIEMEFERSKLKETTNQQATDLASNTQSQANPDQDVQMTGNGFGNFDLDNHNLQRNPQIIETISWLLGSQLSNATPTTFLGGRPLIPSNHGLNNHASSSTMSLSSSNRVSLNNNNSSIGFPSNFSHADDSFHTNLLGHLLQNNVGSSPSSLTPLSQNNPGSSTNVSRLNNGFQGHNGPSIISGNPITYASQNNIKSLYRVFCQLAESCCLQQQQSLLTRPYQFVKCWIILHSTTSYHPFGMGMMKDCPEDQSIKPFFFFCNVTQILHFFCLQVFTLFFQHKILAQRQAQYPMRNNGYHQEFIIDHIFSLWQGWFDAYKGYEVFLHEDS
ncbi:hypothetical protein EYC84_004503 [Monilinia fructicola]|uniref:F-box domain-containing protein n=1 Tax=Monilinia fructicola TaxID=38448 RepID=A0A5M9K1D3_MONFR|nr:hypothetical protein EYC84_004503 [Monilinia fructicola]